MATKDEIFNEHRYLTQNWNELALAGKGRETWSRMQELHVQYREALKAEALTGGNVWEAISHCDSTEVAGMIVAIAPSLSDELLKEILLSEWTRCEAHQPYRADFVKLFRRVGYFQDEEPPKRMQNSKTITIYRGNLGEVEPVGISWTLDKKRAIWFARFGMSLRGQLLGLYRENGIPSVWSAKIATTKILAYFNGRNEKEVVVDPATLSNVQMILQARKAED